MRARSTRRSRIARVLVLLLAATAARAARAADGVPPTPAERVTYWLDRLLTGPEPTTWPIRDVHQHLLLDAERNLVALGPATLDRLADPALQGRVQSDRDANAWHAILSVLTAAGAGRPEVARAWAVPALAHPLLTLRRAALPVIAALRDPRDGAVLAEVLQRDAADRLLGPGAVEALLALGAPWDAVGVRGLLERGPADQPDGTSTLWRTWPASAEASGGAARDDVLAWWALLAEAAGPRAAEGGRSGGPGGRRLAPDGLACVPLPHAIPRGRDAAAAARARLEARGHAPALAAVAEDLASGDEALVRAARRARAGADEGERAAARASAGETLASLRAGRALPAERVREQVASLARDPSAEATTLLRDLLRALPTATTWREPLVEAYLALASRDVEDTAYLEERLRAGTSAGADLALLLARQAKSRAVLDVLERWEPDPAVASIRPRLRREVAFLYGLWAARGGLPAARTAAFARRLAGWIDEPGDPSAAALAGTLTELAGAGDAVLAEGLRGPRRERYLSALGVRPSRYLAPEVTAALLDAVDGSTPAAVRRTTLEAALAVAGADALPAIEALASRLPPGARDDVEVVRRIVRHRTSSRPP